MERYETIPRSTGIEEGLAARVHDPLWLLSRQWQFGEFRAENAASAAWVEVKAETHLLDRWGPGGEGPGQPYSRETEPLERLVEQEPETAPSARLRLEGGLQLRRMLTAGGHGDLVANFVLHCPFPANGNGMPAAAPGGLAEAVRRRVPDGAALAERLMRLVNQGFKKQEAQALGVPAAAVDEVAAIAGDWLSWWQDRAPAKPPAGAEHPPAWDPHRLEYSFEIGATTLRDTKLAGAGYSGGRLDWWAVDAAPVSGAAGEGSPVKLPTIKAVPSPARFGGMPAPRFWEMEDARFDPGAVDAAPNDLGRLLLASFATVYGNDWFVLPVRVPVGSLTRITSFLVADVFGGQRLLGAAGAADDGWNLFALTDSGKEASHPDGEQATHERPTSEWFYLAPAMPDGLEGPPIESVLLLRDEMANLAWAVEARVLDDAGELVDRFGDGPEPPEPAEQPAGAMPRYRVETRVPRNWYPLAPEQLDDNESIRLRLVPLARGDDAGKPELPLGRLLADAGADDLWLHEEEVPRAGAAVSRTQQHARWHDGSIHIWTGRSKRTGGGEGSSGLRFDSLEL
jgi:hypothetical protein